LDPISSGTLQLQAPTIANTHPSTLGLTGAVPLLQGVGAVTLSSNTLLNQGAVSSTRGNINLLGIKGSSTLAINAVGGAFNAASGAINIGASGNQLNVQLSRSHGTLVTISPNSVFSTKTESRNRSGKEWNNPERSELPTTPDGLSRQ
jgi:hypothetical protein